MEHVHQFIQGLFTGRLSRREYYRGLATLFPVAALYVVFVLWLMMEVLQSGVFAKYFSLFITPLLVLNLIFTALGARRLHDIGWVGWFMLAARIPIIDVVLLITTLLVPSRSGGDVYGETPSGSKTLSAILWNSPSSSSDTGERWLGYVFVLLSVISIFALSSLPSRLLSQRLMQGEAPVPTFITSHTQVESVLEPTFSNEVATSTSIERVEEGTTQEENTNTQSQEYVVEQYPLSHDLRENVITGFWKETLPPSLNGKDILNGDWYALEFDDGKYRVLKILKTYGPAIFFAQYHDSFNESPVTLPKLEQGYDHDVLHFLVFSASKPHFIQAGTVTEDEQKRYEEWLWEGYQKEN
jgi:uncharacterized membrane protein YhaH (DUF805 family)